MGTDLTIIFVTEELWLNFIAKKFTFIENQHLNKSFENLLPVIEINRVDDNLNKSFETKKFEDSVLLKNFLSGEENERIIDKFPVAYPVHSGHRFFFWTIWI